MPMARRAAILLTAHLMLAACNAHAPGTVKRATAKPATAKPAIAGSTTPVVPTAATLMVKQIGATSTLTGKVKLISDNGAGIIANNGGGLISDNGAGIISNNTGNIISNNSGALISDNGGGLVSDNGGGIIANNGGGLVGKTRYGLLDADGKGPAEFLLADAVVTVELADGRKLVDEHGKPLTITTDKQGNYKLSAVLPSSNVVLRVALHNGGLLHGGGLAALTPHRDVPARTQPIDTTSSLGAAYVLGKYVGGSQATYDKLPAEEADNLYADLSSARGFITKAPSYKPDDLVGQTETLRGQAPAVSRRLDEIKALLLGQANLGAGRPADTVAVVQPQGLVADADGSIIVGEGRFGRLRQVDPSGHVTTLADVIHGKFKHNFMGMQDLARMPDGSLLVANPTTLFRLAPDGTFAPFAGDGTLQPGAVDVAATKTGVDPLRLVVMPDGTVYVGEGRWHANEGLSRVLAVGTDGVIRQIPLDLGTEPTMEVSGLAVEPDGSFDVLRWNRASSGTAELLRCVPNGASTVIASGFPLIGDTDGYVARGGDGTLYVSSDNPGRVTAIAPDGTQRIVAGEGGPAGTEALVQPVTILPRPDGSLLVSDVASNVVWRVGPQGDFGVYAGIRPGTSARVDLDDIGLNAPEGAAFDDANGLDIAESGANVVRRFDGSNLVTLAGSRRGYSGNGGPASASLLSEPITVAAHGKELYVFDSGNFCLRRIKEDGTIETLVGPGSDDTALVKGDRRPAASIVVKGSGLAVDAKGRPCWVTQNAQIVRLEADGTVSLIAGAGHTQNGRGISSDPTALNQFLGTGAATPTSAADTVFSAPTGLAFGPNGDLFVADTGGLAVYRITDLDGSPTLTQYAGAPFATALAALAAGTPDAEGVAADQATLVLPGGLAFDKAGNMYVGELGTVSMNLLAVLDGSALSSAFASVPTFYARIRKVDVNGKVTTVAGPGTRFFPNATAEDSLVLPEGLSVSPDGRLGIVDTGANLIRILPAGSF